MYGWGFFDPNRIYHVVRLKRMPFWCLDCVLNIFKKDPIEKCVVLLASCKLLAGLFRNLQKQLLKFLRHNIKTFQILVNPYYHDSWVPDNMHVYFSNVYITTTQFLFFQKIFIFFLWNNFYRIISWTRMKTKEKLSMIFFSAIHCITSIIRI